MCQLDFNSDETNAGVCYIIYLKVKAVQLQPMLPLHVFAQMTRC